MESSFLSLCVCLLVGFVSSLGQELGPDYTLVKVHLTYYHTTVLFRGLHGSNFSYPEEVDNVCGVTRVTEDRADVDSVYQCTVGAAGTRRPVLTDGYRGIDGSFDKPLLNRYYVFQSKTKPFLTFNNSKNECISVLNITFHTNHARNIIVPSLSKLRSSAQSMFKRMNDLNYTSRVSQLSNHTSVLSISLNSSQKSVCDKYFKVKFSNCIACKFSNCIACNNGFYYVSELEVFALGPVQHGTVDNIVSNGTVSSENVTMAAYPTGLDWLFQVPYAKYTIAILSVLGVTVFAGVLTVLGCVVTSCRKVRRRRKLTRMNPAEKDYAALEFLPMESVPGVLLTSAKGTQDKTTQRIQDTTDYVMVTTPTAGSYVDQGPTTHNSTTPTEAVGQGVSADSEGEEPPTSTSTLEDPFNDFPENQQPFSTHQEVEDCEPDVQSTPENENVLQKSGESSQSPRKCSMTTDRELQTPGEHSSARQRESETPGEHSSARQRESETPGEHSSARQRELQPPGEHSSARQRELRTPGEHSSVRQRESETPGEHSSAHQKESETPEENSLMENKDPQPPGEGLELLGGEQQSQALAKQYPEYDKLPLHRGRVRIPTTSDGYAYLDVINTDKTENRLSLNLPTKPNYTDVDVESAKRNALENRKSLDLRTRYGYANVDMIEIHNPLSFELQDSVFSAPQDPVVYGSREYAEIVLPVEEGLSKQDTPTLLNHDYTEIDLSQ